MLSLKVRKIFVNLAVRDLNKSKEFFSKLGCTFNPQFTNERAACMVLSEGIYAMLLMESFFKTFTKKEIVDAKKSTEVLVALSVESKEKVNEMVNKAIDAGGKEAREPEDHGWMYGRSFEDLDGHSWEIIWMDSDKIGDNKG
ncbi:MAG: VOC family protein [Candidatus Tectomicrobia bacterium]|uniref:VOC family protein n=1 Tax=Tectimicrobiota bacterium TaxID=2528274 RepID=A0A933GN67_UNCTE|nr:VOC family protein [Candidatus Tectomicrobia bacterium]